MDFMQPISASEPLVPGAEGDRVAELQRRLSYLGYYHGDVDERYGDMTVAAVREFQRVSGQSEDDRTELETWDALDGEVHRAGYDPVSVEEAADAPAVESGAKSEDGQWQWDGAEWQPVPAGGQDSGVLSEDGLWRWDGTDWVAAQGPAATGGSAGLDLAFSVADPTEWRELARNLVPFEKWTAEQKMRANDEYQGAVRRMFNNDVVSEQYDIDQETFRLLHPYTENFRDYIERSATANLGVSPSYPKKGQRVTLTVNVHLQSGPVAGRVIFKVTTSLGSQNLGTRNLVNGSASIDTSALPKGQLILAVEYPTQNVDGVGEVVGDTDEAHYEVE